MPTDDYDLPDLDELTGGAGGGGGTKRRGGGRGQGRRRRWPWFVAGLVVGVLAAVFVPDLARPYLPGVLRSGGEQVTGPVLAKRTEAERLLLTVDTDRGALLAVIRRRVPEIDLLVDEGDSITLSVDTYAPLLEDPVIAAVRKPGGRRVPMEADGEGRPPTDGDADALQGAEGAGEAADGGAEAPEGEGATDTVDPGGAPGAGDTLEGDVDALDGDADTPGAGAAGSDVDGPGGG